MAEDIPTPLAPGATVGILGGGQLGRMLALAAARLGIRSHIYCPETDRPAAQVATSTVAEYEDEAALTRFARAVDVVTYEFENIPRSVAAFLDHLVPVRPSPQALTVAQDRFLEKSFLRDAGIATAPFAEVSTSDGLGAALAEVGIPAVLKTRRFGYDGKGQAVISAPEHAERAWAALGNSPAIVEAFVPFTCELSVIVARGLDGRSVCYDPVRNDHERHILARSTVPAGVSKAVEARAKAIAERVVATLDYVGVMGVEMFFGADGGDGLFVNELAPRVHNSGHWTTDACVVSQFEQHVRAICGWPLGSTRRHADAVMNNLLGDAVNDWQDLSTEPGTALHIYGKDGTAPGRKMGHATRLFPLGTASESAEGRMEAVEP